MEMNRDLQRQILQELADCYPSAYGHPIQTLAPTKDQSEIITCLLYLAEHGLLRHGLDEDDEGWNEVVGTTRITARGLDFLADDGGLSAVLGVVTIRLHSDTIKDLIEAKIAQSDLAPADKKRWIDQLRSLPADATKHLVQRLVEKGLDSGPAAVAAIGAFLKSQGLW
ncbi:hypothetical protein [Achromobacter xylosoxidans]|uniref:hypothetical protein n=1 Tax=Alcaligenes xylosoxydans xylosoxydans TaxID=85698 RepID=UPI002A754944|nr:hypothetical protein [Achromobacter xylosoxidans]WPQ35235.1 hypothetical protein SLH34_32335 [Achromobacter xylosoxidans]